MIVKQHKRSLIMTSNGKNNQEHEDPQNPQEEAPKEKEAAAACESNKHITINECEWEHLKKEAHEFKDKYLRSIAESENLRKRLHKERHDMTQMAVQSVVVDFLNPIDHMENALSYTDNMSDEVKNWAIGFKMILNQFKEVLANNDVHPFKSLGTPFDPHQHEAVEMIETQDVSPGLVMEENIKGYKMGSKVIRPARVKVSKKPAPKTEASSEKGENQPETTSNN